MYINTSYQYNRSILNDNFKSSKIQQQQQQFNGCLVNNSKTRFSDSMQRKYNFSDESFVHDDQASCSSLSTSFSSISPINIYNLNDKNASNSYTSLTSSFDESLLSSSSSSLSSSSSSLSLMSPVWTSALYSPCLHSNLFRTWSANLIDHDYTHDSNNDPYTRSFSLSSYSLDHKQSKKLDDYVCSEVFHDYNRFEDDNGQYLISYQEINKKINDLLNSSENNKTKEESHRLKEITNSSKNKFKDYFKEALHVNTFNKNDMNSDENLVHLNSAGNSNKSTSPKPKFIAPRFEKKWLENQNNFNEYASKNQLKQLSNKTIMKPHTYDNNSNITNTMAISTTNNLKINNTNKKIYQQQITNTKQSQLNYFKRNNLLNNNKSSRYLNQKSLSVQKRNNQCKCLNNNNNKCNCYSTNALTVANYTNENEFYSNRNLTNNTNNYNTTNGYNYIQTQQTYNTSNNQSQNNRYRYSTKSRT